MSSEAGYEKSSKNSVKKTIWRTRIKKKKEANIEMGNKVYENEDEALEEKKKMKSG